ncbi:pali-domain-containing protein [Bimuria novae-zelandiae CBS 107.79]|uniref:Pali-domain-containing protein n=1 Tax=Bimuria novae-zelandiae CBS 107.79 TaxID=1447943 RepID=A0A6A5V0T9_9PLEO|nr:pali-domain-containing protein [Bimuria novae-zelandiae CBS 107.79]
MLRPATPLSILFFAAFVLLLLSTLSTPIIKSIPLATFRGVRFGTFGYCDGSHCKGPMIGYDTDNLFADAPDSEFSLPSATRHSLSSILIVHPVAALMTLICFALAVAAHFHSPAHSPRYLLALLILTFPTLLVSLLAFLVDILLFVPHLAWGGWIVLAATIIIVASGVVTCAMRRTLVSRKARKRMIAENAEMNGQNYYANRNVDTTTVDALPKAESPPPLSGETTLSDNSKNAGFGTYEVQKPGMQDDTIPLNTRNPSLRTNSSVRTDDASRPPLPPMVPSGRGRQPVDQYGNPVLPMPNGPYVMQDVSRMGPPPGRGGSYGRGRGGPPQRGYGPRGGRFGPPRGGMRGQPPPGWIPTGQRPGPGNFGRGAPPPGYNNDIYAQGIPSRREPSPYNARGPSPPTQQRLPIGQAIEMDARTGSTQGYGLRESDGDVQGMLALQQTGFPAQAPQRRPSGPLSPSSEYSTEEDGRYESSGQTPPATNPSNGRGLSPIQDSPVELSAQLSTVEASKKEQTSDYYYEDVDPRFAEPLNNAPPPGPLPSALVPGVPNSQLNHSNHSLNTSDPNLLRNSSFEDDGSRSPAASEASHFTSVSQRGVNPNWRPAPGPPMPASYGPYGPRRPLRQEDVLEVNAANPNFALPGAGLGRGGPKGRGRGGTSAVMNAGLDTGRYPGATVM